MKAATVSSLAWWGVSALSLVGLGVATYLSAVRVSGHGPACDPGGGCETVTASSYAVFLGIPVAMIGVAGYSVLLLGSLAVHGFETPPAALRRGMVLAAALGVGFSAYLTAIQRFAIHAFCVYCLTSASMMTVILVLTVVAVLLGRANNRSALNGGGHETYSQGDGEAQARQGTEVGPP